MKKNILQKLAQKLPAKSGELTPFFKEKKWKKHMIFV